MAENGDRRGDARWTLVTGASSGIGAEIARAFARRGRPLVLSARRVDRLEALAADLPVPVAVIPADLAAPGAAEGLIAAVAARGIPLHTLVNNAGFGLRGRLSALPAQDQTEMVAVNVTAPTVLSRLVLPGLIARRSGGILNVASVVAYLPGPNMAAYYASKAYLLSLSEALYEEARPHGVTVTAVCPGATATEFSERADVGGAKRFTGNVMAPDAVAEAAVAGHLAGRAVVIPGAANRAAVIGARLMPRWLSRKVAARLQG
ncbi:SDR family NAD(P)-dependent oxidoreductase [Methylobacterium currus]|uniref:SDR family NAD(P)-dependent oxidoreductase n=1 Tax=Methylobacterium currus TaxID=2051553 RepID=A0A2R4WPW9_9HYPH|nr:SDR family oxidoreductase [Methylobacterium currus]AWB23558.1 SDR family NAD(P)-dependent oxidoreductase [Methylobacterium currus]UHC16785.1 SDR family oxidoreductase [Methylobacterium currus]